MARRSLLPATMVALIIIGMLGVVRPAAGAAQGAPESVTPLMQVGLEAGELPIAPAFIRLLRITMEPDSESPLHTHPGPEFNLVESGTVRVKVDGKALMQRAAVDGVAQPVETVPVNEEQVLRGGDMITYMPQTALTFRNTGTKPAVMLAAVVLPAGSQHPPGLVWVGQAPTAEQLAGVTSAVLGDGVATSLPTGATTFSVDQVTLDAGTPLPGGPGPALYSLVDGLFDFTIQSGSVQVSRVAEPGPRPESPAGTAVSPPPGDAMFFPNAGEQSERNQVSGAATFYRVSITPSGAEAGATPIASASPAAQPGGEPAVIAIAATPAPVPTATPTQEATPAPTQAAETPAAETPAATATAAAPAALAEGVIAIANDDGVRVRDQPTTEGSNIVGSLKKGDRVRITGPSVEADGFTWWPIEGITDPTIVGYAAGDFLDVDPNQQP